MSIIDFISAKSTVIVDKIICHTLVHCMKPACCSIRKDSVPLPVDGMEADGVIVVAPPPVLVLRAPTLEQVRGKEGVMGGGGVLI